MTEVNKKRKPKYGYTALKYFAYMGVLGLIGLCAALIGIFLNPPLNMLLMLVGIPVAFVGLYIAASYAVLYNSLFKREPQEKIWRKIAEFLDLRGMKKFWM